MIRLKGCGFYRSRFMKEKRLVRMAFMCVYLLHFTSMREK